MPSRFMQNLQVGSDGDFNVVGGEIYATFSPWASWMYVGASFGNASLVSFPTPASTGGASATAQTDPGSVVAVTSGGITFNLLYDAAAMAAPPSFRAGIQQAAAILGASIFDKITVNIKIDYSGTGGGAAAGPDHGLYESYTSIRTDLTNNATPGDTTFNALPAGSSIQGQSSVAVWNAQLKLLGLMGANDTTTDDGSATFATDINANLLVGVALHELTHALGRIPYGPQPDVFDLFRFTSAGTRLFSGGATAPAAYFSIDGGITKLADYGRTSDASDFLNSGVQGPNDPFNEFYTGYTLQQLTAADLKQMDALGFHLVTTDTQAPTLTSDNPLSIQADTAQTISSSLLGANDNVSSAAQLHYTIATGPSHGTLLLSGSATSSFTQADINNGLVSYHETASGVTSDSFFFKVTDAAGNATGTDSFQININPFDALEYLASNSDLIQAFGLNLAAAEQHYVTTGFNEGRATHSFDALEYLASNPDLIKAFGLNLMAAEQNYVQTGFNEGRATHSFDALEYLDSNTDLIKAFGLNPLAAEQHYITNGFSEHRATNSFNAAQYLANYPDLVAAFGPNNLVAAEQHYITNGFNEGRTDQAPVINGDSGNNTLVAKNGAIMTGGAGADTFVFNSSLLTPATITDFAVGTDHLQISTSGFGDGLTSGGTAPLVAAATAASATHAGTTGYFIFDNSNTLWWDPTGGSGTDAIALAKLTGVAALHTSDFLLA
jgi:Cadherin-like